MKEFNVTVPVKEYTYTELDNLSAILVEEARKATYRSYSPYSHFRVGAAIALDNGQIITGANQENAAFTAGTCAERSACFAAGAQYPDAKFVRIAVAARDGEGEFLADPVAPCGHCRQALLEFETRAGHDIPVLLIAKDRVYEMPSVKSLLPLAFTEF